MIDIFEDNTFKSMILEQNSSEYYLMFKFAFPDQKTTYLHNIIPLTTDQKNELRALSNKGQIKNMVLNSMEDLKSSKIRPDQDVKGDLYTIKYMSKAEDVIQFAYLTPEEFKKVEKEVKDKNLKKEEFDIHKIEYNELLPILQGKTIKDQYNHRLLSVSEIQRFIDKTGSVKAQKKTNIVAQRALEKEKRAAEKEKEGKKSNTSPSPPEYTKQEKEEGVKFFTDDVVKLLSKIVNAHAVSVNLSNNRKEIEKAKENRQKETALLIDKIKEFTTDQKIIEVIFKYYLKTKIPIKYGSLYNYIVTEFINNLSGKSQPTSEPSKSKKTLKTNKNKKNPEEKDIIGGDDGDKKYTYELTFVDPKGDNYVKEKRLSIKQAKGAEEIAKKNNEIYNNYLKKLDAELEKAEKDSSYALDIGPAPNVGFIDIKIKEKVEEMSSTGGGATAVPGAGEGVATKYAFTAPETKNTIISNKRILKKSKNLKESYQIKNEAKMIFLESLRWLINKK